MGSRNPPVRPGSILRARKISSTLHIDSARSLSLTATKPKLARPICRHFTDGSAFGSSRRILNKGIRFESGLLSVRCRYSTRPYPTRACSVMREKMRRIRCRRDASAGLRSITGCASHAGI